MIKIEFPEFAEDGDESAEIVEWKADIGDQVKEGQEILELLTDKAAFTVPAPCNGTLTKIHAPSGETVQVGAVLGEIEEG